MVLIAVSAYLIYKYGFAPQEVIAFMRLIRPGKSRSTCEWLVYSSLFAGMVVGPQQAFMNMNFATWIRWVSCAEKTDDVWLT